MNSLAGYRTYKDIILEIQIRTILQHAWAEINHGKNYKLKGSFPPKIERRLNLLARALEMADNEFENIIDLMDVHEKIVEKQTEVGNLNIPLDSTSLEKYLLQKFPNIVISGYQNDKAKIDAEAIKECKIFGIKTVADFEKILSKKFIDIQNEYGTTWTLSSLAKGILIAHDPDRFFEEAFTSDWGEFSDDLQYILSKIGLDLEKITEKYDLTNPDRGGEQLDDDSEFI